MRAMLVGMPGSVHMTRIADTLLSGGWEVAVFPSDNHGVHAGFRGVTLFQPPGYRDYEERPGLRVERLRGLPARAPKAVSLAHAIRRFRPDVISAQEIMHGGYVSTDAARLLLKPPPIVMVIWGSDMSLRARIPAERQRIQRALGKTDVLTADCERDLWHARRLGYAGETAMAMPIAGGFDIDAAAALMAPGPPSRRRTIGVKGYQHFAGRAQVALRALELCGASLSGMTLALHSVAPDEEILARRVAARAGMELEVVATRLVPVPHEDVLRLHGRSRISVGLSIADGISTGLLEAMLMGSFPIQSGTACVNEWIEDGRTALVVPPEDPHAVAAAVKRALSDDALVDSAAAINATVARARLDAKVLDERVLALYARMAKGAIVRASALPPPSRFGQEPA
ncbi:MAG: glycosyltransferase [Chloroflexota bacterium]